MIKNVIGDLKYYNYEYLSLLDITSRSNPPPVGDGFLKEQISLSDIWIKHAPDIRKQCSKLPYEAKEIHYRVPLADAFNFFLICDFMILDAVFLALFEYLSLSNSTFANRITTSKKRLDTYVLNIYANKTNRLSLNRLPSKSPLILDVDNLLKGRKNAAIESELEYIDETFGKNVKCIQSILNNTCSRHFNNHDLNSSQSKSIQSYTSSPSQYASVYSCLFNLYLMNRALYIFHLLYLKDSNGYEENNDTIFTSLLFSGYAKKSLFSFTIGSSCSLHPKYDVGIIVERWKKHVLCYLYKNELDIDGKFWNELSNSFSASMMDSLPLLSCMMESLYITFQREYCEHANSGIAKYDVEKYKRKIIETCCTSNNESVDDDNLIALLYQDHELEFSPFNYFELAYIKMDNDRQERNNKKGAIEKDATVKWDDISVPNFLKNGCPLRIFYLNIADIEKLLKRDEYVNSFSSMDDINPVLPNVFSPIPCHYMSTNGAWSPIDKETLKILSGEKMFSEKPDGSAICICHSMEENESKDLKIDDAAQKDNKLMKVRKLSIEEWITFFDSFCQYHRSIKTDSEYCINEKDARKCKKEFLQSVLKIKSISDD